MKLPIYMDTHATTPVDPRVFEEMIPCFEEDFGNPSSRNHSYGWKADEKVEKARQQVADLIGAGAREIVFTSGATESDNLALKGAAQMYREKGNHIITCVTEHKAVLDPCKSLEKLGFEITILPVSSSGMIDLELVRQVVTKRTILISLMAANNEIGVLHPLKEIGKIAKEKGILFHTDAAQAVGKIPIDVEAMGIHLTSFSAHKMYGPKGVGALYVREKKPRVRLVPMMDGGGHERGFRSGTLNVPGIVGFGKACEMAQNLMTEESKRLYRLREKLQKGLTSELDEIYIHGDLQNRLPHNLNISFAYLEAESLLGAIRDDVAVSSGSACMSANLEPSYVLPALGVPERLLHSSIRFGLSRFNTDKEVEYVIEKIVTAVKRLRSMSPIYEMIRREGDSEKFKA